MTAFAGFPRKQGFTPLPALFFSDLLPQIKDMAELKTTLYIFWKLYQKRGYPRFVTYGELASESALISGLGEIGALRRGLEQAESRGTILHLALERDGKTEDLYFLNTENDREALLRIKSGELSVGGLPKVELQPAIEAPNIFVLYEQNIGMLTPMIADELKEAEKLYPAGWIEEAFREAASLNKRSWRYVSRILERWAREGKANGEPGRDSEGDKRYQKYFRGKYGHIVRG